MGNFKWLEVDDGEGIKMDLLMVIAKKICRRCSESKILALEYSLKSDVCKSCISKENHHYQKKYRFGVKAVPHKRVLARKSCSEI